MTQARETDMGERLFEEIGLRLLQDPEVTEGTGFGTRPGLRVGTKIFARLGRGGELIVKLPSDRVDQLVASGIGARFEPRRDGRLMREWATIPVRTRREWSRLVDEALRFVRSTPGKASSRAQGRRRS